MAPRPAPTPILPEAHSDERLLERSLPSGRSLVLRTDGEKEQIELRNPTGDLEVRIVLTASGPVVTLRGGRLEVESADVAFRCRSFDVQTTADLSLHSDREVRIQADELRARTERDIHLNGAFIRLNCTEDASAQPTIPTLPAVPAAGGCCDHDHGTPEKHEP